MIKSGKSLLRKKAMTKGIPFQRKGMIKDIPFHRKAMTEGIDFRKKGLTEGIAFRRKAMTMPLTLVVTLVVVLAVGLIVYMISSGIITDFGGSSNELQNSSFNTIKCINACQSCCLIKPSSTTDDTYVADGDKCTIRSVSDCPCKC